MLETPLNDEMTEHLGHERHRAAEDRDSTNVRNGTSRNLIARRFLSELAELAEPWASGRAGLNLYVSVATVV